MGRGEEQGGRLAETRWQGHKRPVAGQRATHQCQKYCRKNRQEKVPSVCSLQVLLSIESVIKRGDRERVHGQMLGGRFTPLGVSQLSNLLSHVFTKKKGWGVAYVCCHCIVV